MKQYILLLAILGSLSIPLVASAISGDCTTENSGSVCGSSTQINKTAASASGSTGSLRLNSAPLIAPIPMNNTYTPWELLHRTPMLAGFTWIGPTSSYITPAMYLGTPVNRISPNMTNGTTSYPINNPVTTYSECLKHEAYISYGLGERIEESDIRELKAIAKICAREFYGRYFDGKDYTTREEFLMMLFTLFAEPNVGFHGTFSANGTYISSNTDRSDTGYTNIDPQSWYASYLKLARYLNLIDSTSPEWQTGKMISDREAIEMLSQYTAYRMNFQGESLEYGTILLSDMQYLIEFVNKNNISIQIR